MRRNDIRPRSSAAATERRERDASRMGRRKGEPIDAVPVAVEPGEEIVIAEVDLDRALDELDWPDLDEDLERK